MGMHPNSTPLTAEQSDLAERYIPLAVSICKRMGLNIHGDYEDFLSEAYIGLVEAARSFDESMDINFYTHARNRIRGSMLDFLKYSRMKGFRTNPEAAPESRLFATDDDLHDDTASNPIEWIDSLDAAEGLLRLLPAKHATVLRMVAVENRCQREVGQLTGQSQANVNRLIRESHKFLDRVG